MQVPGNNIWRQIFKNMRNKVCSVASVNSNLKTFTQNTTIIMRIQDKNKKNSIKSKNYPKKKTLRELEKLEID